ncbi:hypothetical protein [Yoonia sp. 208BN28-4]|uniref:hypothetical protein n=1 Tax=Yoonia sp. 208BN28-4 TaxID=3126505 RepID=UPI0030970266
MTPNFALSLSFDGIRLMHRVSGGWHLVDEVALDDPDLTAALARLRRTAVELEPSGIRTKLLLPNDQIKYLAIDSTQTTIDDVRDALQGATPYPVDDLVIDFDRSGGRTHIAAVARETLSEAESFAEQHRFAPVCFAAVAEPYTFSTEVFFGMTKAAPAHLGEGAVITRDPDPVTVIGRATMPNPPMPTDAMPLTTRVEPEDAPDDTDVGEGEAQDAPDSEPVLTFSRAGRDEYPTDDNAEASEPLAAPEAPERANAPKSPSLPEIDEPVFSSRARAQVEDTPAPPAPPTAAEMPPEPVFSRRRDQDSGTADGLKIAEDDAPQPRAPMPAPPVTMTPAVPIAPSAAPPAPASAPAASLADPAPRESGLSKGLAIAASARNLIPKRKEKPAAPPPPTGVGPLGGTVAAGVGGKPRFLGLMLTAGLLIFLMLVALWASTLDEDGIAGLFGFGDNAPSELASAPEVTAPIIVAPEEPAPTQQVTVAPDVTETPVDETPPTPIVTTVPGRVLSPGEADRIYAATGVWQRAPRLPALPESNTLEGLRSFANVPVVAPATRPRDLAAAAASLDTPFLAPPNPAAAGTIIPRDDDGFILASADGTVMPNGVLVYAKAPAVTPPARPRPAAPEPEPEPDTDANADTDPATETDVAVAPENPLASSIADAIAEATQPDTDGLTDTPDDAAQTEEDVEPAEILTAGGVSLASLRPAVRPDGLAPPQPFADETLAGLRPSLRPEGLAPPPEEEPEEEEVVAEEEAPEATPTDIASVIANIAAAAPPSALVNPTRNAIVASPRPDTRPNNFSRVVASAQQNAARQQQQQQQPATQASAPAVASSAAARPSGAIPRSVAAAATIDSAINLRSVNLIGVYGRPNDRRALIRLSNGSYVKVEVGSALEGGRVTAIGDSALNYVVRGQTYALQLPSG